MTTRADDPWLAGADDALLEVHALSVSYRVREHVLRRQQVVRALEGVSLHVDGGETLAVVGESGSGKSTLARAVLRLIEPDGGQVLWHSSPGVRVDLLRERGARLRALRQELGVVFQDPSTSLNPRMSVGAALEEPLRVLAGLARPAATERAHELARQVGLDPDLLARHPHRLSGGQRQRVAIARALASNPRLLVCDEVVSALDVSVQAQVLDLFDELQETMGLALLFITHDLAVVRHVADRVAVLDGGRLVELGRADEVLGEPGHPVTRALLAAEPRLDPGGGARPAAPEPVRADRSRACAERAVRLSPTHVVLAAPPE